MNIKKHITVRIMAVAALAAFAEPEVTDVVAKQRYPWNGLVDIACKVTGINGTENDHYFSVAAVMPDSGDARKISRFWVVQNGTNTTDRIVRANGSYRLVWDASADLGQVIYDNMVMRVNVKTRNKVQLWKGGPYWAEMNIGAEEPEDYGYYFWWGDTVGYKRENDKWVASDGSSSNFSFDYNGAISGQTYGWSNDALRIQGWIAWGNALAPAHDAAHVHWGGGWRMPTYQEWDDLGSKCTWTWTTQSGVRGYVIKGKGDYATASIFLPACGGGLRTSLDNAGSTGGYWSSDPYAGDNSYYKYAMGFGFSAVGHFTNSGHYRSDGMAVRPVQGFTE